MALLGEKAKLYFNDADTHSLFYFINYVCLHEILKLSGFKVHDWNNYRVVFLSSKYSLPMFLFILYQEQRLFLYSLFFFFKKVIRVIWNLLFMPVWKKMASLAKVLILFFSGGRKVSSLVLFEFPSLQRSKSLGLLGKKYQRLLFHFKKKQMKMKRSPSGWKSYWIEKRIVTHQLIRVSW